jgi:hypothetical protein
MSDQAQEGIFLLFLAVLVAVLWLRGYLTAWINDVTSAVTTPPGRQPFTFPTPASSGGTRKAI